VEVVCVLNLMEVPAGDCVIRAISDRLEGW